MQKKAEGSCLHYRIELGQANYTFDMIHEINESIEDDIEEN